MGRQYWGLALAALCGPLEAATLQVQLSDNQGQPLSEAVLWVEPGPPQTAPAGVHVDQRKRQFVPYILAVQTGTRVSFPNADPINHHVYSFSTAKRFELRLQKSSDAPQQVLFDKPGLVTLGCNIHDWMLGFVLVLDSPWFAQTDAQGLARIDYTPAAGQRLHLWHPRIADAPAQLVRELDGSAALTWQLAAPLKRDPRPKEPTGRPKGKGGYAP
jgi:plastocyanin